MEVVKKINNNVVLCLDNNQNELIAFGKGIGFPATPYLLSDLSKIQMTFYKINPKLMSIISDIPSDILKLSAEIVLEAKKKLPSTLNPNLFVSLADHINFTIYRLERYREVEMIISYDIENLYPLETEIAKWALGMIKDRLNVVLPESEITSLAMHFVNSKESDDNDIDDKNRNLIISDIVELLETKMCKPIDRKSYSFNRFVLHLRYFLLRVESNGQFSEDYSEILSPMKEQNPNAFACAKSISEYLYSRFGIESTHGEVMYIMMHVHRLSIN